MSAPSATTPASAAALAVRSVESPLGALTVVAAPKGLRAILWPDDDPARAGLGAEVVADGGALPTDPEADAIAADAARQLDEYFDGRRMVFELPFDLQGTDFQREVWLGLADVGFARTRSYGEQADHLGRPKAVRAVAAANGRNPVSIVLPCHRIVGADGTLTGFAGGLDAKAYLLDHERRVMGMSPRWSENRLF